MAVTSSEEKQLLTSSNKSNGGGGPLREVFQSNGTITPEAEVDSRKSKYKPRQWLVLLVLAWMNFGQAICISLQAPFYPAEASKKGASATEYGLVFGVFQLVIFVVSPFYGKYMMTTGPKFFLNTGILMSSVCSFLFGFLGKVEDKDSFIWLSFAIRVVQGMGEAAYTTAAFTIIAKEFPNKVATTFAALETCFGLGIIAGPTVGGALYQVGGYILPFTVMGSFLFVGGCITHFILPPIFDDQEWKSPSVITVLLIPPVFIATLATFCSACSIGFIVASLEPHLRRFNLQPIENGAMFIISGGVFGFVAPIWGMLCDRTGRTKLFCVIGAVFVCISFTLLGPAPFVPMETQLWLCGLALVFNGIGVSGELVCAFLGSLKEAVKHGQPDNLSTYGLISALWSSSFALGAFVGPTLAGILLDTVGFRVGSLFILIEHALLAVITISYMLYCKYSKKVTRLPSTSKDIAQSDEDVY